MEKYSKERTTMRFSGRGGTTASEEEDILILVVERKQKRRGEWRLRTVPLMTANGFNMHDITVMQTEPSV